MWPSQIFHVSISSARGWPPLPGARWNRPFPFFIRINKKWDCIGRSMWGGSKAPHSKNKPSRVSEQQQEHGRKPQTNNYYYVLLLVPRLDCVVICFFRDLPLHDLSSDGVLSVWSRGVQAVHHDSRQLETLNVQATAWTRLIISGARITACITSRS